MTDDTPPHATPGDDTASRDVLYKLTPEAVVQRLADAGVPRDLRTVQRWCLQKSLDCRRDDTVGYFVTQASVDAKIVELRQLLDLRERRQQSLRGSATPSHATPGDDTSSLQHGVKHNTPSDDAARRVAPRDDAPSRDDQQSRDDEQRHATTRRDTAPGETGQGADRGAAALDIFEHPYVKKLEAKIDKLEDTLNDTHVAHRKELMRLQEANLVAISRNFGQYMLEITGFRPPANPTQTPSNAAAEAGGELDQTQ